MKKSFKKAGAAVLSMAMLLSMGVMSMPTYATGTNDNPEVWPGQVKVTINKNSTWADDSWTANGTSKERKFQYLDGVKEADVTMYRVATLSGAGWVWDPAFSSAVDVVYNGDTTKLNDFQKLLATEKDASDKEHFTATSEELLQVASALERVTRDTDGSVKASVAKVDTQHLSIDANGNGYVYLPSDAKLEQIANAESHLQSGTKDVIGYYLITTTTNDAGVVLQPVLITLKNSKTNNGQTIGDNPVEVALKGYTIDINKTINTVKDKDKGKALGNKVVSDTGETAIVAKDDIINYKIETEIPKYDVNLANDGMKNFEIIEKPTAGITVVDTTSSTGTTVYKAKELVVTATRGTGSDAVTTTLVESTGGTPGDYTVDYSDTGSTGGFKIVFAPNKYHTKTNTSGEKLEGQKITVTFDATVNDEAFVTENYANATYEDLKKTDIEKAAIVTEASTVIGNNTDYENNKTAADAITADGVITALKTTLGVTGDLSLEDKIAVVLAGTAASATDYTTLTKEQIEAQRARAKELIAANATYTTATTMSEEDVATLKATLEKATDATVTDSEKIQAVLALEDLQATPAGNKNEAGIRYGNEYATAQGDGKDDDDATVYSVDLDLTKITETLILKNSISSADRTSENRDSWYEEDTASKTPVSGAVFELIKNDDADTTGNPQNKSLGLAVSDANGKLWLLTKGTAQAAKPEIATTVASNAIVYYETVEGTNGADDTYIPYTVKEMVDGSNNPVVTNQAWRKLTKGTYTLKELYAPAGYKKWESVPFTIDATTDSATKPEFTGAFTATTTDTEGKIISGGTLEYAGTEGSIKAEILNPKADELPATGGIGTVLFTAGGISIVLIAGALFVMYMKKRNSEEEE